MLMQLVEVHGTREHRLRYAAYYTPARVADSLVRWAIDRPDCRLIDPSFGGCAFLGAAARRLQELGASSPSRSLMGVDVDPACWSYIEADPLLEHTATIQSDFLAIEPEHEHLTMADVVAGNPPFLRHHDLSNPQVETAQAAANRLGISLPKTASLWAYFVIHAVRFLSPTGKLALVLPRSLLEANYAEPIRSYLRDQFASLLYIEVQERFFEHTDEAAVILLAHRGGERLERVIQVRDVESLGKLLDHLGASLREPGLALNTVTADAHRALSYHLCRLPNVPFGSIGRIQIGVVTGRNKFFIVPSSSPIDEASRHGIVPGTRSLSGLHFTTDDAGSITQSDQNCWLVTAPRTNLPPSLAIWRLRGVSDGVHRGYKCSKRQPWFVVPVPTSPPAAFATCSRSGPPLLVLNSTDWYATNALHHVDWVAEIEPAGIATSILTSVAAVWSELWGRKYGGGVLKMEPGIWQELPIPQSRRATEIFPECSQLVRQGREDEARALADNEILIREMGLARADVEELQRLAQALQEQRRPLRT